MSRKNNKPAATPPKPLAEEPKPPVTPPTDASPSDPTEAGPRILQPWIGEPLKPGTVDPVAYAKALATGAVGEIARPDDAVDPSEPVFHVDPAYKHPNDTAGKRWVKVELERSRGNIGAVEEIIDDAGLPALVDKIKAELIDLRNKVVADSRAAADAADAALREVGPEPIEPLAVTIGDVLSSLAAGDVSTGRVVRTPEPKLTRPQAELQHRIYRVLTDRGVSIKRQEDVYGWLLDQIAAAVAPDAEVESSD